MSYGGLNFLILPIVLLLAFENYETWTGSGKLVCTPANNQAGEIILSLSRPQKSAKNATLTPEYSDTIGVGKSPLAPLCQRGVMTPFVTVPLFH